MIAFSTTFVGGQRVGAAFNQRRSAVLNQRKTGCARRAFEADKRASAECSRVDILLHDCPVMEAISNSVVDIVAIGQIMRMAQDAG